MLHRTEEFFNKPLITIVEIEPNDHLIIKSLTANIEYKSVVSEPSKPDK